MFFFFFFLLLCVWFLLTANLHRHSCTFLVTFPSTVQAHNTMPIYAFSLPIFFSSSFGCLFIHRSFTTFYARLFNVQSKQFFRVDLFLRLHSVRFVVSLSLCIVGIFNRYFVLFRCFFLSLVRFLYNFYYLALLLWLLFLRLSCYLCASGPRLHEPPVLNNCHVKAFSIDECAKFLLISSWIKTKKKHITQTNQHFNGHSSGWMGRGKKCTESISLLFSHISCYMTRNYRITNR